MVREPRLFDRSRAFLVVMGKKHFDGFFESLLASVFEPDAWDESIVTLLVCLFVEDRGLSLFDSSFKAGIWIIITLCGLTMQNASSVFTFLVGSTDIRQNFGISIPRERHVSKSYLDLPNNQHPIANSNHSTQNKMSIKNVVLVGADGNLGPGVLNGLVAAKTFTITVLKRQSSKSPSNYPPGVQVKHLSDSFPIEELVPVLKNQDAVISTVYGGQVELQKRLADAAVRAGVKRFIPSDFGSCDSQSERAMQLAPIYVAKSQVRDHLEQLARQHPNFSWTSLVCGHFFDWDLGFFHIDLGAKKFEMLDDGEVFWSTSTFAQIGRATAAILQKLEDTRNRFVYIQSFRITQKMLLKAYEKATGDKWEVKQFDSGEYVEERKKKADGGDKTAVEDLVWVLGTLEADWEARDGYANELLGLQQEDLDEVVQRVVAEKS